MFLNYVLKSDGFKEQVEVLETKDDLKLTNLKFLKSSSKKRPKLLVKPISLDTETSHNHEADKDKKLGWIYQWAFKFNNKYYGGRTPSDFMNILDRILDYYNCDDKHKIVIYVHNLSYDLTYLIDIFISYYGRPVNMLATKANSFIQIEYDRFIMRDSYTLANRSLDKWSKDLITDYRKAVGAIDYDIIRYQDDILTDNDWYYQLSDVATLDDCIVKELKSGNYTLQKIPLTSTGFVREYARKQYKMDSNNYKLFQDTKLDEELYIDLDFAYMGALTHGNNMYMGELLEDIRMKHRDKRSFYPSTQRKDTYPVGKWRRMYNYATDNKRTVSVNDVLKWSKNNCLLITFYVENITLLKGVTFPILQVNKCLRYRSEGTNIIKDNGKVVKLNGSTLLCLTDLDFKIMLSQYHIEKIVISKVNGSKRGKLPEWLINTIDVFMKGKSFYKNEVKKYETAGDINNAVEANINLMKSKNKLNGIYGMTATRPVRDEYIYDEDTMTWNVEFANIPDALDKFYKSRNNFMSFQWGCFVTAWTRYRLISMISKDIGNEICEGIGYEKAVYCDTDSLFYFADDETERIYEEFNKRNYEESLKNGEYVEVDGKIVEYMTWELEPENITSFKFLHSKCYGYICDNNPNTLKITIAGVPKYWKEDLDKEPKDRRTREDELGTLDNLSDMFKFVHCGGSGAVYTATRPQVMTINGHVTELARACIITETTKTLREINDTLIFWEEEEQ